MVTENQIQLHQRRYQQHHQQQHEDMVLHQQQMGQQQHQSGNRNNNGLDAADRAAALQQASNFVASAAAAGMDLSGLIGVQQVGGGPPGSNLHLMSSLEQQNALNNQRKQREFIPDNKKDDSYWDRRRRNNEAAKRSREKRRINDMVLEGRVLELSKENHILRAQLSAVRDKYGINPEGLISIDAVLASLPSPDQVLSLPRPRSRLLTSSAHGGSISPSPSNRSLSPVAVSIHQHSQQPQQQQQRQSVLMSLAGRQRSPSPYRHIQSNGGGSSGSNYRYPGGSERSAVGVQSCSGGNRHFQHHVERPLPPLPALTPVTSEDHQLHQQQEQHDKVNPYFDLCSSSSSDGSHSPIDPAVANGRVLPLKLRHKSHLGADAAATASAAAVLLTLNGIKHEPDSPLTLDHHLMIVNNNNSGRHSSESCSDERDSGVSSGDWVNTGSPSSRSQTETESVRPGGKRMRMSPPGGQQQHSRRYRLDSGDADVEESPDRHQQRPAALNNGASNDAADENDKLRSDIARLASELESIKTLMMGNAAVRSNSNISNNNNNNNYRLH